MWVKVWIPLHKVVGGRELASQATTSVTFPSIHPSCVMCRPTLGPTLLGTPGFIFLKIKKDVLGHISMWWRSRWSSGRSSVAFHFAALGSRGGFLRHHLMCFEQPPTLAACDRSTAKTSALNFRVSSKLSVHYHPCQKLPNDMLNCSVCMNSRLKSSSSQHQECLLQLV